MKSSKHVLLGLFALTLGACNESNQANVEPDWIHNSDDSTLPTPHPTPSTSPSPSASPIPTGSNLYNGPAEVEKYVVKFVEDARIQGIDVLSDMTNPKLTIQIAKLDSYGSSVIGLCETGGGQRRVTFDPDFWNTVSETQKELLAHHELGHCVLYRAHRSSTLSSGAYASIMYPLIMSSSTYLNNYDYYQQELFTYGAMEGAEDPSMVVTHVCDQKELAEIQENHDLK